MAFSHRLILMNTDGGFYVDLSERLKMSFTILFEVDTDLSPRRVQSFETAHSAVESNGMASSLESTVP